jgi:Tfp pilus assembly protein PilX
MSNMHKKNEVRRQAPRGNAARGMALITTLLLLSIMMAMTLSMVIAVTSDTLIAKYYRNARSSFYAADSGVNVARQSLINQLTGAVSTGTSFSSTSQPIPVAAAATALANVLTTYSTTTSLLGGQAASSWPSKFQIAGSQAGTLGTTLGTAACTVSYTGTATNAGPYSCTNLPTCAGACVGFGLTNFQYVYPYTITALGQSIANEQQIVEDAGSLTLNVHVAPSGGTATNFAAWGMFIDQFPICSGGSLVPGTITGPVFTNGAWTFGNSGSYTFTDKVGSVSPNFGWQNGSCTQSPTYPQPGFSTTFQSTVTLGANPVPLPTNDFNQKEAVVDGLGNQGALTTAQMNAALKTNSGTPYPAAGTTNPGVYMPYSQTTVGGVTTNTMTGGGIYVEGNANSVVLTAANPTIGGAVHKQQVVTVTQGNAPVTTTTITFDYTTNTTTMASQSGGGATTTTTISGVTENFAGSPPAAATMLYVNGAINSLSGPSSGAAIQDGAALTVDAGTGSDITITGNITYKNEPVTLTQNQIPGTPADTLIPGNNTGQVLGIFTNGGNVNLSVPSSGQNLEIDASIATIKSGGSGGLVNTGNALNTLTIVGGRIQNTIQNINTTTRNVWFDRRFAQGGFAPPWFPSTTVTSSGTDAVTSTTATVQRTQWLAVY